MCRALLMTFACLMILLGIGGLWILPQLVQQKIEQLKIGTENFDRFTKVPLPITVKFYIFNITNKDQVLAGQERPKFEEVGPFVYKQWRRREIVDFEDFNRRVRYREYKTFYPEFDSQKEHNYNSGSKTRPKGGELKQIQSLHNTLHNGVDFYPSQSNSSGKNLPNVIENNAHQKQADQMLDPHMTKLTIINLPLLTTLTKLAALEEGTLKRNIAARVVSKLIEDRQDKILVTKMANEILFDGYKVDFMESVRELISGTFNLNFDSPLPNNKFGFFYMKNNTWNKREVGDLTIFSGRNESMNDFMQVHNWNDLKELNVWPSNTEAGNRCNQIKGTDGSQFHPDVKRSQVLMIFSPQICTSLYIKYKEDTQTRGIPLLRFTTPAELFAAPKKNPKNACYCTIAPSATSNGGKNLHDQQKAAKTSNGKSPNQQVVSGSTITDSRCYLDGLIDLSLCQRGAPVAVSSPHFYNGDPMLAMAAGLKPNKEIHETYIDIEPMTGSVLRAASRVQLNAYVERAALDVVDAGLVGKMTPMVAPMIWLEESAEIDEKMSDMLKAKLLNTVHRAKRNCIYALVFGSFVALTLTLHYWYFTCYKIDTSHIAGNKNHQKLNQSLVNGAKKPRAFRKQPRASGQLRRNLIAASSGQRDLGSKEQSKSSQALLLDSAEASGSGETTGARRDSNSTPSRAVSIEPDSNIQVNHNETLQLR